MYRTRAFARLAGVTVRAPHHYDRLGLLTPSGRTDAGYRLYSEADLERLAKRIHSLLDSSGVTLAGALCVQRGLMEEKKSSLERTIQAVSEAEMKMEERKGSWSPELQERVSAQWKALVADVGASLGDAPESSTAERFGGGEHVGQPCKRACAHGPEGSRD